MTSSRNYIKLDEKVNTIHSIPPRAKILHGEICALSQSDGYCFSSNKYFAKQLNLSIQSVSRLIGILKRYDLITVTRATDDNGYRKRIIKPNSSITLSKISVGNAQKREKHTLKNANHNAVSRIDKIIFLTKVITVSTVANKIDENDCTTNRRILGRRRTCPLQKLPHAKDMPY